MYGVNF
jgi:exosome complex component RRP42